MSTSIASATIDVNVNRDYLRQLGDVHTQLRQFSRKVTAALRPISIALGGFGAIAVKRALENNYQMSDKWQKSMHGVNSAMGSVGEKILKASFAGKTLFEWMDKFAKTLSNMTQKDVQKLVDAFMVISGVLVGLKGLTAVAGLANATNMMRGRGGITRGEFVAGELAGGAASVAYGGRAGAGAGAITGMVGSSNIFRGMSSRTQQRILELSDMGGVRNAAGARVARDQLLGAGAAGAGLAKGGIGFLGWGALITVLLGTAAAGSRALRKTLDKETGQLKDAWDSNRGTLSNTMSELTLWFDTVFASIETFGRVLGSGFTKGQGIKSLFSKENWKRIWGQVTEESTNEADEALSELYGEGFVKKPVTNPKTGRPMVDPLTGRPMYYQYVNPIGKYAQKQAEDLGKRLEELIMGGKGLFSNKELRNFVVGGISNTEFAAEVESRSEKDYQNRKQIAESTERAKKEIDRMREIDVPKFRMEERWAAEDLAELKKSKFKDSFRPSFYNDAQESYRAATQWPKDMVDYQKEMAEFEKDKQRKIASMEIKQKEAVVELKEMKELWKKLIVEAAGYTGAK